MAATTSLAAASHHHCHHILLPSLSVLRAPNRVRLCPAFPSVLCSSASSASPQPTAGGEEDEEGRGGRLSKQSSWEATDGQGDDYLYRLGKEAENMNIAVGARSGVIDDLFVGKFLGRDSWEDQDALAEEQADELAALNGKEDEAPAADAQRAWVAAAKVRENANSIEFFGGTFPADEPRARGCFHWPGRVFGVTVLVRWCGVLAAVRPCCMCVVPLQPCEGSHCHAVILIPMAARQSLSTTASAILTSGFVYIVSLACFLCHMPLISRAR